MLNVLYLQPVLNPKSYDGANMHMLNVGRVRGAESGRAGAENVGICILGEFRYIGLVKRSLCQPDYRLSRYVAGLTEGPDDWFGRLTSRGGLTASYTPPVWPCLGNPTILLRLCILLKSSIHIWQSLPFGIIH